jgi:hypothetical protein
MAANHVSSIVDWPVEKLDRHCRAFRGIEFSNPEVAIVRCWFCSPTTEGKSREPDTGP